MFFRYIIYFLISICVYTCNKDITGLEQPKELDEISDKEYAVISKTVDSLYSFEGRSKLILVDSTTITVLSSYTYGEMVSILNSIKNSMKTLDSTTIESFKLSNTRRTYIKNPKKIHPNCVLSSATDKEGIFISVSRVGFNVDGKQALVYIGSFSPPRAGMGAYHLLSSVKNDWVIIKKVVLWRI